MMKKLLLLIACICSCSLYSFCQGPGSLVIKAGDDLSEAYRYIYKYPQFQSGKVYRIKDDVAGAKMNYNLLSHAMQFIDAKGDTLDIANETEINFISIGKDTFYYSMFYVQQVADFSVSKLLAREYIQLHEEKVGAYGIPSSTLNIESKKIINEGQNYLLSANVNMMLSKKKLYYFSDYRTGILTVNSKNIFKVFSRQKEKIKIYMESSAVDFNDEPDLIKLFTYIQTISQ